MLKMKRKLNEIARRHTDPRMRNFNATDLDAVRGFKNHGLCILSEEHVQKLTCVESAIMQVLFRHTDEYRCNTCATVISYTTSLKKRNEELLECDYKPCCQW